MLQYLQAQQLVVFKASIGRYDAAAVLLAPPDKGSQNLDALCLQMADRPSLLPCRISITCIFKLIKTTYSHDSGHPDISEIVKNM
jgi:hypothetical protein